MTLELTELLVGAGDTFFQVGDFSGAIPPQDAPLLDHDLRGEQVRRSHGDSPGRALAMKLGHLSRHGDRPNSGSAEGRRRPGARPTFDLLEVSFGGHDAKEQAHDVRVAHDRFTVGVRERAHGIVEVDARVAE